MSKGSTRKDAGAANLNFFRIVYGMLVTMEASLECSRGLLNEPEFYELISYSSLFCAQIAGLHQITGAFA